MDPMPDGFDFMVQPTATFITSEQVEIVLSLLSERADPVSIPVYVSRKCSGVDLTVEDVEAIRDGNFHVSGCDVYYRMVSSGHLVANEIVDDFFQLLPTIGSLDNMRRHMEQCYGYSISDLDLVDLYDGLFRIVGPPASHLSTREKYFVPRSVSSEAVWMFSHGCSSDFVSNYIFYRFGCYLPPWEIVRLAVKTDEEMVEDAILEAILASASRSRPVAPSCLNRHKRRVQPPPPIFTTGISPILGVEAVHLSGGTFTANPMVRRHNDNGTYTLCTGPDHLERTFQPAYYSARLEMDFW